MRTEFQPCDPYLQLAAHYFHDAYVSTGMTCSVLPGYRGNILRLYYSDACVCDR
jgi:hypothetical protein